MRNPYGQTPKYLLCDNDSKFGSCFARVAATSSVDKDSLSRSPSQCDLWALLEKCAARMPRPSADPSWETTPACPQCVCDVLQPGTTASGHPAANSSTACAVCSPVWSVWEGDRRSSLRWVTPWLPKGGITFGKRVQKRMDEAVWRTTLMMPEYELFVQ